MDYVWVFIGGWFSCIIAIHIKMWWVCRMNIKVSTPSVSRNRFTDAIEALEELVVAVDKDSRASINSAMIKALRVLKQHQ